jgi:hypothetical protein
MDCLNPKANKYSVSMFNGMVKEEHCSRVETFITDHEAAVMFLGLCACVFGHLHTVEQYW